MKIAGSRIAIFIWQDWFHPKAGGAEYYCHCLSQILVSQGAMVTIVACKANDDRRSFQADGVQVERIAPRPLIVPATFLWYWQNHQNFDLIIDFTNKVPYLTPLYVRQPLIAAFMHTNGITFQDEWGAFGFAGQFIEDVLLSPYRKTSAIAISNSTKNELKQRGFKSVEVGIVPTTWTQPKPAQPDEKPRLVVVSRLRKYKRIDLLIQAIAIVKQSVPTVVVDIIGRGPDETRLRQLINQLALENQITLHGFVDDQDRDELLSKAWLTTITSRKEGWGITISEAAQFGVPTIGVDAPGTRDAIIDGQTGILLADDSAALLAETIVELIHDPKRRHRLGKAAQDYALTYTADKLEETWLNAIKKVLKTV